MRNIAAYILFAAALLLISACATRKASLSVDHHATEQAQTTIVQEQGSQRQETTAQATASEMTSALRESLREVLSENLRVHAILYDTNKPVDSLSGKPPVLAEVTVLRDRQNAVQQERNTDVQTSGRSASEQNVLQADSSRTELTASSDREETTKLDEKTKTTQRVPWWVWMTGLGVIVAGWLLLRKRL